MTALPPDIPSESIPKHIIFLSWGFSLLLVGMPLIFATSAIDPVTLPRLLLFTAGFSLLELILIVFPLSNKPSIDFRNSGFLALLGYGLITILSVFWAHNRVESLMEIVRVWLLIQVTLFTIRLLSEYPSVRKFFLRGILGSAFIICAIGIVDAIRVYQYLDYEKVFYWIDGTMANRNLLSSILFLAFPFLGIIIADDTKIWKSIAAIVGLAAFGLIVLIQSRAVWLAIIAGAGVMLFFGGKMIWRNSNRNKKNRLILSTGLVFVSLLGSIIFINQFYIKQLKGNNGIEQRLISMINFRKEKNEHTETINERLMLWDKTLGMIRDYPVLGVGAGNWKIFFPEQQLINGRGSQGKSHFQRPHNDFLWVWSELGPIGMLTYLTIFFFALRIVYRRIQPKNDHKEQWIYLFLGIGLMGWCVISFFDFPKERILHLTYLGVMLGILWARNEPSEENFKQQNRILWTFQLLVTLAILFVVQSRFQSELATRKAMQARLDKQPQEVIKQLNHAESMLFSMDYTSTPLDWYHGKAAYDLGDIATATKRFEQADLLHPFHIYVLNDLGSCYFAQQKTKQAEEKFVEALAVAPHFFESNLNMAAIYAKTDLDRALGYVLQCPARFPSDRYRLFLTTLMPRYISRLEKKITVQRIQKVLRQIKGNPEWMMTIHSQMQKQKTTLESCLIENAIYYLHKKRGQITLEEAESLRMKYKIETK